MKQVFNLKETEKGNKISSPEDLFKRIKEFNVDFERENFILIGLNTKNKVVYSEVIFKGGLDMCMICPKLIFRKLLLNNCAKGIVAHNHPSGDLNPSDEDRDIYKRLKNFGKELDLKILDSIIFNTREFYSLNDWR